MSDDPKLPVGQDRPLTAGEVAVARSVFGNSIDYDKVRVHRRADSMFVSDDTTLTPNGQLYCGKAYEDDFSKGDTHHFIHEMTHVWQYQNKVLDPPVAAIEEWVKSGFDYKSAYSYKLDTKKDLTNYNLEQQAEMVADYYGSLQRQKDGNKPTPMPKTPEDLEKGFYGFMLKRVNEVHAQNPQDPQVKGMVDQHVITFDAKGQAHFTQSYVDKLTASTKQFDAQMKQDDADRLQVLRKFIADPSYVNPAKAPAPVSSPPAAQPPARTAAAAKPAS